MSFESFGDFLHMGGYARYVWPCYLLFFAVAALNVWSAVRMHGEARERALRRDTIDATRAGAAPDGGLPQSGLRQGGFKEAS